MNNENWMWRTLRFLSRRCPTFYVSNQTPGRPIKDYIINIMNKIEADEEQVDIVILLYNDDSDLCMNTEINSH